MEKRGVAEGGHTGTMEQEMKASKKQKAAAVERVKAWRKTHQWSLKQQWERGNARRKKNRRPTGVEVNLDTNETERSDLKTEQGTGGVTGWDEGGQVGDRVPALSDRGALAGGVSESSGRTGEESRVTEWLAAKRKERGVEVELKL